MATNEPLLSLVSPFTAPTVTRLHSAEWWIVNCKWIGKKFAVVLSRYPNWSPPPPPNPNFERYRCTNPLLWLTKLLPCRRARNTWPATHISRVRIMNNELCACDITVVICYRHVYGRMHNPLENLRYSWNDRFTSLHKSLRNWHILTLIRVHPLKHARQ
jgi:hypothetical protein